MDTKNRKVNDLINQIKKKNNIFYEEFLWLIKKENINSIQEYFNDLIDLNLLKYNGIFTRLKRNVLLFNSLSLFSIDPSLNEENKIVYEGFLDKSNIINNSDYFTKTENLKNLAISLANRDINEIMEVTKVLNLDSSNLILLFEYILGTSLVLNIDDVLSVNKDINLNEQFVYNMCVYQEIPEKMKESILCFLINDEKKLYTCLIRNKKNHSFFKEIIRTPQLNNKINICGKHTYPPLLIACQEGHLDIVKYLLTSPELTEHADINHKDSDDWNALSLAIFYGHLEIANYLLQNPKIKIYINNKNKIDPIILACQEGQLEILQYLLNNSKLQNDLTIDCKYIINLLFKASKNGYLEIVKYLLTDSEIRKYSDIDIEKSKWWAAISEASKNGHLDIVQYLLTSPELKDHANIHHKNSEGQNILLLASKNGHLEIVKYLLGSSEIKTHAEIDSEDNKG